MKPIKVVLFSQLLLRLLEFSLTSEFCKPHMCLTIIPPEELEGWNKMPVISSGLKLDWNKREINSLGPLNEPHCH
jgi:hypothetical protein